MVVAVLAAGLPAAGLVAAVVVAGLPVVVLAVVAGLLTGWLELELDELGCEPEVELELDELGWELELELELDVLGCEVEDELRELEELERELDELDRELEDGLAGQTRVRLTAIAAHSCQLLSFIGRSLEWNSKQLRTFGLRTCPFESKAIAHR